MTKGNGKSNGNGAGGNSATIGTIELDNPDVEPTKQIISLQQFLNDLVGSIVVLDQHMSVHCAQIAELKQEVAALKKGLSAPAETVSLGENNG